MFKFSLCIFFSGINAEMPYFAVFQPRYAEKSVCPDILYYINESIFAKERNYKCSNRFFPFWVMKKSFRCM